MAVSAVSVCTKACCLGLYAHLARLTASQVQHFAQALDFCICGSRQARQASCLFPPSNYSACCVRNAQRMLLILALLHLCFEQARRQMSSSGICITLSVLSGKSSISLSSQLDVLGPHCKVLNYHKSGFDAFGHAGIGGKVKHARYHFSPFRHFNHTF